MSLLHTSGFVLYMKREGHFRDWYYILRERYCTCICVVSESMDQCLKLDTRGIHRALSASRDTAECHQDATEPRLHPLSP